MGQATFRQVLLLFATLMLGRPASNAQAQSSSQSPPADYAAQREAMVAQEIEAAGITNPRVLAAMRATPRHEFVPAAFRRWAYLDGALPIGDSQTISPPFIVAFMTQAINPQPDERILEIGTGSGYQAAVLSPLAKEVYTIEIVERLGQRAKRTLDRLGYQNISVRVGDGFAGWPEKAPFDKIIVTCSPEKVPQPLVEQLRDGGQMIIPVGERYQQTLYRLVKQQGKLIREPLEATLFVPMTGAAEDKRQVQPDPLHPAVVNGGFEDVTGDSNRPVGWHYLRQAVVERSPSAPSGARYLSFANVQPGLSSQVLQGFAVDGRQISRLAVSCRAAGQNLAVDGPTGGAPAVIISFFDDRRAAIADGQLGPWTGTFGWRRQSAEIAVPLAAREAILALGLHGATGRLDIDELTLAAAANP